MFDAFDLIREFLHKGGSILWIIFAVTMTLWALIYERYIFLRHELPVLILNQTTEWNQRKNKTSWFAHRIRESQISQVSSKMNVNIPLIKALVSACPLLGLLGTVTGMIAVFDVMAVTGTGNARLMASGISMATIPTMAGMVAALSGLYFGSQLEKRVALEKNKFSEYLLFQ